MDRWETSAPARAAQDRNTTSTSAAAPSPRTANPGSQLQDLRHPKALLDGWLRMRQKSFLSRPQHPLPRQPRPRSGNRYRRSPSLPLAVAGSRRQTVNQLRPNPQSYEHRRRAPSACQPLSRHARLSPNQGGLHPGCTARTTSTAGTSAGRTTTRRSTSPGYGSEHGTGAASDAWTSAGRRPQHDRRDDDHAAGADAGGRDTNAEGSRA